MARVAAALLTLLLAACASLEQKHFPTLISAASPGQPATYLGLPLASGQIVVSDAAGPGGLFFALMLEQFFPFVHAGLIIVEDGRPYVYDATGQFFLHFGGPPTDAMRGGIGRVALDEYLRHAAVVAIYDPPPGVDRARVAAFARDHYARETEFDPYFDSANRDKFYCAEFVALALEAGGAQAVPLAPMSGNPSLKVVLDWLKIRASKVIPASALIDEGRHVGTLSLKFSPAQIQAYFDLKRELHRRFTPDQKLGNVFHWSGRDLKLRDEVQQFMTRGLGIFAGQEPRSPRSTAETVQALAAEIMGPVDAILSQRPE